MSTDQRPLPDKWIEVIRRIGRSGFEGISFSRPDPDYETMRELDKHGLITLSEGYHGDCFAEISEYGFYAVEFGVYDHAEKD